jgi:hypothetical protein
VNRRGGASEFNCSQDGRKSIISLRSASVGGKRTSLGLSYATGGGLAADRYYRAGPAASDLPGHLDFYGVALPHIAAGLCFEFVFAGTKSGDHDSGVNQTIENRSNCRDSLRNSTA